MRLTALMVALIVLMIGYALDGIGREEQKTALHRVGATLLYGGVALVLSLVLHRIITG